MLLVKKDIFYLSILIFCYLLLLLLMPRRSFDYDMWCWIEWSRHLLVMGAHNAYTGTPAAGQSINYPPLWLYILDIYAKICGDAQTIQDNSYILKYIAFTFEFASVLLVYLICRQYGVPWFTVFFLLLNPAFLYNSYVWGQVDGVFTFFAALSLLFAFRQRSTLCIIFFLLALYTKFQAIIFLPIAGLLLLQQWQRRPNIIARDIVIFILVNCAILFPFILHGNTEGVFHAMFGSIDYYPYITMNAYNIWYFVKQALQPGMPDNESLLFLNYRLWGLILFFTGSFIVLLPLLKNTLQKFKGLNIMHISAARLALIASVIPLLFFYFNTQMHERYSHPALLFLFIYAVLTRRYAAYILVSLAYFLNMEDVMQYWDLNHKTVIFDPRFIAGLYTLGLTVCMLNILRTKKPSSIQYETTIA